MVITGKGIVYGANGSMLVGAVAITAFNRSIKLDDEFDLKEIKDSNGEGAAMVGSGKRQRLTIEFVPSGDSIADAEASANAALPEVLSKITISDCAIDAFNGNWSYVGGGSITLTNDDVCVMLLPAMKWENDISEIVT